MKKFLFLITPFLFFIPMDANVLDDLIIKKKPLINQIIIELLEAGMTDEWKNLDSSVKSKIGTDTCEAGDGSYCNYVTSIGEGICKAGGGSYCNYVTSIGEGICKAGDGSYCNYVTSIGEGICKAGGGSYCNYVTSIGEGICKAGDGSYCNYVTSIGEGICKAGGGSYCNYVNSIQDGIDKIPYKDRTYWWDRFRDQYGNYQWRCRGGQTKQFAENSKCSGVSKDDDRWPG